MLAGRLTSSALIRARVAQQVRLQQVVPRRGKAVSNWKRPSMEEYGVPTESWQQVCAKENKRWNMQLVVGVASLAFTLFFAKASGLIQLNGPPYHLMKNEK